MVVGQSGRNADRVTAALEQARVRVVRVGSATVACEKLASTMPQVVILVTPMVEASKYELTERSSAVGAVLVEIDERLEGDEYEDVVNDIITTAITRKMARDDIEPSSGYPSSSNAPNSGGPSSGGPHSRGRSGAVTAPPQMLDDETIDDGWDD
jgi:hypothetical protein